MTSSTSRCSACQAPAEHRQFVTLFRESECSLHECTECKTCFFPDPDWLDRAYSESISKLDTGIAQRTNDIANVLAAILTPQKNKNDKFLDYGGGYGILARTMRDRGFNFSSFDPLTPTLFSLPSHGSSHFKLVTLIEVLEHLTQPLNTLREISQSCDLILISTLTLPPEGLDSNWWYLLPDTGQHVFFPSREGLKRMASDLNMHLKSNGENLHLLSRKKISRLVTFLMNHQRLAWMIGYLLVPFTRGKSLAQFDMEESTAAIYLKTS
jgi:hypothetical protein